MPAYRVLIRDLKRFSSFKGTDFLPVLEIQQMAGRAGRPKYDTEGEAILLPKTEAEARYAWDNYVKGEPEKIYSKLGVEPVLRVHVLALIASGICATRQQLMDFFFRTFYAHQYKDLSALEGIIDKVLVQLADFGFIESGVIPNKKDNPFVRASELKGKTQESLKPTLIGRRVSELYIDPLTANHIIRHLNKCRGKGAGFFPLLHLLCNSVEMKPLASVKKAESEDIESFIASEECSLLMDVPNSCTWEYEEFLRSIKTAMIFNDWAEEIGEDFIMERRGVSPGELHARLERMDWMLYSAQELALLLGLKGMLTPIKKARIRVKNGVREELLPLIRLKGVGRVRARKLWSSNIRSIADMRKAPQPALERILGEKIAADVKEQLGSAKLEEEQETLE
jgi:helicase